VLETDCPSLKNSMIALPDERLDDLQNNGLMILQKKRGFRFGMDSILLKDFARIKPNEHVADLGTGSAVLPLLLSQKEPSARFSAFEWQADIADMAVRSVRYNQLESKITVYCEDLRNAGEVIGKASADVVISNPPYGKKNGVMPSRSENKLLSRHETDCLIADIIAAAGDVLKNRGRMYMVFPSHRMLELFDCMRMHRLEPKRLRMVCGKASKAPYLLLIEAVKNAKPMLQFMPPLIVHREDGTETEELKNIYQKS